MWRRGGIEGEQREKKTTNSFPPIAEIFSFLARLKALPLVQKKERKKKKRKEKKRRPLINPLCD